MRGQIVAADNGSPIRRAQVRVSSPEARDGRIATTDAQGRFEIKELVGGRYTITASKGGFVSLQYGQRRPSESGTPIELADGQTLDKLAIALPRGSVLGGRITDEFGEPVANATVVAIQLRISSGRATPAADPERQLARHDRRPGTLPVVRPSAGRVLRQRDAATRRRRSHRSDGRRTIGLRGHLLSRHAEHCRGVEGHAGGLAGKHQRVVRPDRHASRPRRGTGDLVGRIARCQRHGGAAARQLRRRGPGR